MEDSNPGDRGLISLSQGRDRWPEGGREDDWKPGERGGKDDEDEDDEDDEDDDEDDDDEFV